LRKHTRRGVPNARGVVLSLSAMQGRSQGDHAAGGLEPALQALDDQLDEAARALKIAVQSLRKAQNAARTGNLRDSRRLLETARENSEAYSRAVRVAEESWQFEAEDYLGSERFLDELRRAAEELGLHGVRVLDGRLYCYPNIVRMEARDVAVRLGNKKHSAVRPSHLARLLKSAQAKPRQGTLAPLLEAIEQAYLYVSRGELGHAVALRTIYDTLTLRPGSDRDYTLDDFVMDMYRLDESGPHVTKANHHFDLPASTSTRGGRGIRFATRQGEEKLYSTIRFRAAR
jgi:hypothetical protein